MPLANLFIKTEKGKHPVEILITIQYFIFLFTFLPSKQEETLGALE